MKRDPKNPPKTTPDRGLIACQEVARLTDTVVLKFSGGKDSVASWLVLREHFKHVVPIFHYWVPNLKFVEETVKLYEDFFDTEIIRAPHPNFMNFLADGAYQPPHRWNVVEAFNLSTVDYDEIVQWVAEDAGYPDSWVAVGIKSSDSPIRRQMIEKNGAWSVSRKMFYPACDMNKAALLALFEKHQVPISDDYKVFGRSFDGLQYRYLKGIREHYPKDFSTILKWFPLVEAEFMRRDAHAAQSC